MENTAIYGNHQPTIEQLKVELKMIEEKLEKLTCLLGLSVSIREAEAINIQPVYDDYDEHN